MLLHSITFLLEIYILIPLISIVVASKSFLPGSALPEPPQLEARPPAQIALTPGITPTPFTTAASCHRYHFSPLLVIFSRLGLSVLGEFKPKSSDTSHSQTRSYQYAGAGGRGRGPPPTCKGSPWHHREAGRSWAPWGNWHLWFDRL